MNKTFKIYIALLVIVIAAIVFIDVNAPRPVDWSPTYSVKDKIPYGLYIVNQEIKTMFKKNKFETIKETPYEYFVDKYDYDTLVNNYKISGNFLCVSESCEIDTESAKELCYFASHGNTVFISAQDFSNALKDTLKLKIDAKYNLENSVSVWLANKKLGNQKYNLVEGAVNNYFSKIDTLNTTVLGYQSQGKDSVHINFIKVKCGSGNFILHTQPAAFTNIHMLKDNHAEYTQKILSYIPRGNFYTFSPTDNDPNEQKTELSYIFSQPPLKWAWLIFILGTLLFMIFNAKRKQRIVPIKNPLTNTTVDFTKTIGNLYYLEGDINDIINKKIIYFLAKIRNEYFIDTSKLDNDFVEKLHQKSGKDKTIIQKAVFLINTHKKSPHSSITEDLIQINNAIENIIIN